MSSLETLAKHLWEIGSKDCELPIWSCWEAIPQGYKNGWITIAKWHRAQTAAFARFLWACIPSDCTPALARIKRDGLMDEARPVILKEAVAGLKLLKQGTPFDVSIALEVAAQHWIADHEPQQGGHRESLT